MCQKKIMRKRSHESLVEEPPKKRVSRGSGVAPKKITPGEVLTDLTGKQWKVGKAIGQGGFGEIYLASDNPQGPVKSDAPYVVKIEGHSNGPLFVEINCFLRIAKTELINQWKENRHINFLGMPHYIASGSHKIDNERLRFLVLPRYDQDLEKIFIRNENKFNLKTVVVVCTQILDVLEYIHSKGYVHCDIKASNIMHSAPKTPVKYIPPVQVRNVRETNPQRACRLKTVRTPKRTLRPVKTVKYKESDDEGTEAEEEFDEYFPEDSVTEESFYVPHESEKHLPHVQSNENGKVYLLDFGLATKYRLSDGQHRQYCNDERKAHAGTILFCSLDAHLGAQSRRSDLESLGYNMIYWLTSKLPWENHVDSPEAVQMEKKKHFQDIDKFLRQCFGEYPQFLYNYFQYVKNLTFEAKPDYALCKKLILAALEDYGYKKDGCLDFDTLEGWGRKQKNIKRKPENYSKKSIKSERKPLTSNTVLKKPMLRGRKAKKAGAKKENLNWSKILTDPEEILRQFKKAHDTKPRDRKITDPGDASVQNLDIWKLNPTYAMIEVFNKYKDRNGNYNSTPPKSGRGDSLICEKEGYTPAMYCVLSKMHERKLSEIQNNEHIVNTRSGTKTSKSHLKKSNSENKSTKMCPYAGKPKVSKKRVLRSTGWRG